MAAPGAWARLAFAPVAYLRYLELTLWPSRLAVLYPHPGASLSMAEVVVGAAVLGAISAFAVPGGARGRGSGLAGSGSG